MLNDDAMRDVLKGMSKVLAESAVELTISISENLPTELIGQNWRNLKTGGIYRVIDVTVDSEDLKYRVVYQSGENPMHWDRPHELFLEKFERVS